MTSLPFKSWVHKGPFEVTSPSRPLSCHGYIEDPSKSWVRRDPSMSWVHPGPFPSRRSIEAFSKSWVHRLKSHGTSKAPFHDMGPSCHGFIEVIFHVIGPSMPLPSLGSIEATSKSQVHQGSPPSHGAI